MKTSHSHKVKTIDGGEYVHFGILEHLLQNRDGLLSQTDMMTLQVNIDGLPEATLDNSRKISFWKIHFLTVSFVETANQTIQVEEVSSLEQGFMVDERMFHLCLDCFICNAPARSFIKQTKGHGGYSGCDRCTHEILCGTKNDVSWNTCQRTDESFAELRDENHHSILSTLQLGHTIRSGLYACCLSWCDKEDA